MEFVKRMSNKIDIFCFQEVFQSDFDIFSNRSKMNIYSDIAKVLTNYQIFFAPIFTNYDLIAKTDFNVLFGQATFVKNDIKILTHGDFFIYREFDQKHYLKYPGFEKYFDLPRNIQFVVIEKGSKESLIANVHGYWKPGAKLDTKQSLEQSEKIIKFLDKFSCPKILCGDLNLRPDTKSIKILENNLINLITKNNITNTRSSFNDSEENFADYIFVSPQVNVRKFAVIDEEVSDHLPLYLEFA